MGIRLFVFLFALSLGQLTLGAQEKKVLQYRGFSGGMMIHSAYVRSGDFTVTANSGETRDMRLSGAPFGMGGAVRFIFGRHLRIGTEGYVSKLKCGPNRHKAETGWGGFLADSVWEFRHCNVFIGGTIGGGSQTSTLILAPTANDYIADDIVYRKYSFCAFAPFFGTEIRLTDKVGVVLKADWLLNLSGRQDDFVSGPRLYLGFTFGHLK